MSRQMAEQWLAAAAASAKKKDLDAHMGLISRSVNVAGVPGFDSIG